MAGYIGSKSSVTLVDGYTEAEADAEFVTKTGDTMSGNLTVQGAFTSQGIDDNGNATALTIDSSERVMIGKTDTTFATAGNVFYGDGSSDHTRNGLLLQLNRTTTDGEHIRLLKDGTTVGSIGTPSTAELNISAIGTNSSGLLLTSSNEVRPMKNGSASDNTQDLGRSNGRWKDLYLSGGVYLGGTGSANKLDDYEEGSFNLTMTGGSGNPSATQLLGSTYVKIGKLVSFRSFGTLNNTGASGAIAFSGLPFTPTGVTIANIECNSQGTFSLSPYGYVSGTVIYIQQMRSNNTYAVVNHNVASSGEWSITGHFFTNS